MMKLIMFKVELKRTFINFKCYNYLNYWFYHEKNLDLIHFFILNQQMKIFFYFKFLNFFLINDTLIINNLVLNDLK